MDNDKLKISAIDLIVIIAGLVLGVAFLAMQWVDFEIVTKTGIEIILDNSIVVPKIVSDGLWLIPLGAIVGTTSIIWGIIKPSAKKMSVMLAFFAGFIGFSYYGNFFWQNSRLPFDFSEAVGFGYWLGLLASIIMIIQAMIPREDIPEPIIDLSPIDRWATRRFNLTLKRRKIIWAYIFLAVPIIFFAYIRIYPTLFAFQMSFYDWNPLAEDQEYLGIENYQEVFEDIENERHPTRKAFENTLIYIAVGVPTQLLLALGVALMLNEIRFMSSVYRLLFFLPFVTSTIAISWVFRILYERQGVINAFFETLGLSTQPFLRSPDQALYSILVVVVWQGLGFAVIIFLAGLKQIPQQYYEAAKIDGASRWQSFRQITLPLLNPSIVFLVVLQSISFLRMFAPVYAMSVQGSGGPLNSTTTVVLRVVREAFDSNNYGYSASLTVVLFAIILFVTVVQLRLTSRSVD